MKSAQTSTSVRSVQLKQGAKATRRIVPTQPMR